MRSFAVYVPVLVGLVCALCVVGAEDVDPDHQGSFTRDVPSKHCTIEEYQKVISCICYMRFIGVAMPFNKTSRRRDMCTSFGPLGKQFKSCRFFEQSNFDVFPSLFWLDSFARYCFGAGVLKELRPGTKWFKFFEKVERES